MAPGFEPAALAVLAGKPNLRLVVDPVLADDGPGPAPDPTGSIRSAGGAVLVTAPDTIPDDPAAWTVATQRAPTDDERRDLDLAWRLVRGVTSNAIVLVRDGRLIGLGSGQTSRVDAARGAVAQALAYAGTGGRGRRRVRLGCVLPVRRRRRGLSRGGRHRVRPARRLGPRRRGRGGRGCGRGDHGHDGHAALPPLMAGSVATRPAVLIRPWHTPMTGRDPAEAHRASTPLELLFDLCFVVAVVAGGGIAPPRPGRGPDRPRRRELPGRLLRDLVAVDELHLVRLGVRHGRRPVPAADVRADRRGAGRGGRGPGGVRAPGFHGHGHRLRDHAHRARGAVAAGRPRGSGGPSGRPAVRDGHRAHPGRLGRAPARRLVGGRLPDVPRARHPRARRAGLGRASRSSHAVARRPHRGALRPVHDHRPGRVRAGDDDRDAGGLRGRRLAPARC